MRVDIGLVKGVIGVYEEVSGSRRERDWSLLTAEFRVSCFFSHVNHFERNLRPRCWPHGDSVLPRVVGVVRGNDCWGKG